MVRRKRGLLTGCRFRPTARESPKRSVWIFGRARRWVHSFLEERHTNPKVPASLPVENRVSSFNGSVFPMTEIDLGWFREVGIGEGPDRNRDRTRSQVSLPEQSPSADLTEAKPHFASAICLSSKLPEAGQRKDHVAGREPSMHAEQTSRTPLTVQAVAHRNHVGIALAASNELTAGALAFTDHNPPSNRGSAGSVSRPPCVVHRTTFRRLSTSECAKGYIRQSFKPID